MPKNGGRTGRKRKPRTIKRPKAKQSDVLKKAQGANLFPPAKKKPPKDEFTI